MNSILSKHWLVAVGILFFVFFGRAQTNSPGTALSFNGTNQNVIITRPISNDFTIEFWFKSTQVAGATNNWWQGMGLVDGEVAGVAADFGVSLGSGKVLFGIGSPDTTIAATNNVTDGSWHHVAATRVQSSGVFSLYIDGVLAGSKTASTATLSAPPNIAVGSLQTAVNYFQGSIDEVRIWGVVRNQAQAQATMNTSLSGTESNLLCYLRFDEGTGTTATDLAPAGGNSNGTLSNGPAWISSGAPVSIAPSVVFSSASPISSNSATLNGFITPNQLMTGSWVEYGATTNYGSKSAVTNLGAGLYFNKTNSSYVSIPGFGTNAPTNEITIEFWARTDAIDYQSVFALSPDQGTNRMSSHLYYGTDGTVFWDFGDITVGGRLNYIPPGVGVWQHFALVSSASSNYMRIYRNGVLETNKVGCGIFKRGNYDLHIGGYSGFYFSGAVSEFRVWSNALSQITIQNWMNQSLSSSHPNYTNLYGYWPLHEGAGTTAYDYSPNARNGTLVNNPTWVMGMGQSNTPVSALITNLNPGTLYYARFGATNAAGTNYSAASFMTAAAAPSVITQPATGVVATNATLNATVNANGASTTVYFDYGTTTNYGFSTVTTNIGSAAGNQSIGIPVRVVSMTNYHFRVVAINGAGTNYGSDLTFTPPAGAPFLTLHAPSSTTGTNTVLNGVVYLNGDTNATAYYIWGTTTNYGNTTTNITSGASGALSFDGTSTWVAIPTNNAPLGSSPFTIEAWIKPAVMGDGRGVIGWGNYGTSGQVNAINLTWTGLVNYWWNNDFAVVTGDLTSQWHHLVVTHDGTNQCIYVDGNLFGPRITGGHNVPFNWNLTIGVTTSGNLFSGLISEVRLWNVGRSQAEIRATKDFPLTGTEAGLVGYWQFPETSGANTIDSSDQGFTGLLQNSPARTAGAIPVFSASIPIAGLAPLTTYHFSLVASNHFGTTTSPDRSFMTPGAPTVTTLAASSVNTSNAILNATVAPNLAATTAYFVWGTTANYGNSTALTNFTGTTVPIPLSATLSNLFPGTVYHFAIVASNLVGVSTGADLTFTTPSRPPDVTTLFATASPTNILLKAAINPNGANTTVYFNYGADTNYGSVSTSQIIPAGTNVVQIKIPVSSISVGASLHFQAVATNESGLTMGADVSCHFWAVTNLADSGAGSLRQTIIDAVSGDVITVMTSGTVAVTNGSPDYGPSAFGILKTLSIVGNGLVLTNGTGTRNRFFYVGPQGSLTLYNVTLMGGLALGGSGGDIKVSGGTDRRPGGGGAGLGGAIFVDQGELRLIGCTLAGNRAMGGRGGGLLPGAAGVVSCGAGGGMGEDAGSGSGSVGAPGGGPNGGTGGANVSVPPYFIPPGNGGPGGGGGGGYDDCYASYAGGNGGFGGGAGGGMANCFDGFPARSGYGGFGGGGPGDGENGLGGFGGWGGGRGYASGGGGPGGGGLGGGGAVFNKGGRISVENCTFAGNFAQGGQGGQVQVNTTSAGPGQGGAGTGGSIFNLDGQLTVVHCTLADSVGSDTFASGAAVYSLQTTGMAMAFMTNSIMASGFNGPQLVNDSGTTLGSSNLVTSSVGVSNNVISITSLPNIALLAQNGGLTPTILFTTNSPAVNAGVFLPGFPIDQRGLLRPAGAAPDIGAVEIQPPAITTLNATNVAGITARLQAVANSEYPATVFWNYDLTTNYSSVSSSTIAPIGSAVPVSSVVSNLSALTTYYCRAVISNAAGIAYGSDLTFTTGTDVPTVSTVPATNIATTNVTLNALVNPNGAATIVYFEFGPTTSYGIQSSSLLIASGIVTQPIAIPTAVLSGTFYHFRIVASNNVGVARGQDLTFTTPVSAPSVTTQPASSVQPFQAILNGTVLTNGLTTHVWFEYGVTTNYTNATAVLSNRVSGPVVFNLTGLFPTTTYYFRLVGTNSLGVTYGNDVSFTTPPAAPSVVTQPAASITSSNVVLSALVNPNGTNTTLYFRYGVGTSYNLVSSGVNAGAGIIAQSMNITVSLPQPGALYHFYAFASNGVGIVSSGDLTFSSAPALPMVTTLSATNVLIKHAVLQGAVDINDTSGAAWFEYGTDTNYGNFGLTNLIGNGLQNINLLLTNLIPAMTYHYRLVATNSVGTTAGDDVTFATQPPSAPVVAIFFPTMIGSGVVLNGQGNPDGDATYGYFEYGSTTNYGSVTPPISLGGGDNGVIFSNLIHLNAGDFHCRAVASNSFGIARSGDLIFNVPLFGPSDALPQRFGGPIIWADFNNDGRLDALITGMPFDYSAPPTTDIYFNNGDGTFTRVTTPIPGMAINYGDSGQQFAVGDFDNDGLVDILAVGGDNVYTGQYSSQLWRNFGNGNFASMNLSLPRIYSGNVAVADFNNDGKLDFVIMGYGDSGVVTQFWLNNGNQTFSQASTGITSSLLYSSIVTGDLDNDGWQDVICSGYALSGTYVNDVWRNQGNGTFVRVPTALPEVIYGAMALGDYDNDGLLDILVTGNSASGYQTQIWHNQGGFVFTNLNVNLTPVSNGSAAWGDYDNDGFLDILFCGEGGDYVTELWRNNGDGTFSQEPVGLPPAWGEGATVGWADIDNDGRLDLFVRGDADYSDYLVTAELLRNNTPVTNTAPTAPIGLVAQMLPGKVRLSWNPATDLQTTNGAGLSYNIRVGTTPGGSQIVSPMSATNGFRLVPQLGNAGLRMFSLVTNLTLGTTYYWSVQSIDAAYAGSPFSAEGSFVFTLPPPVITGVVQQGNGAFLLNFNGVAGLNYTLQSSTNLSDWLSLTNLSAGANGTFNFFDRNSNSVAYPRRFYRLRTP